MIHAGLQAAEKGVPFLPLRGILGSDLVRHRPDWRVIDNPFRDPDGADDPILLVPAIQPEVALFHAPRADRAGNVWIGVRRELMTMAHAAQDDAGHGRGDRPTRTCWPTISSAAGTIPALYVTAIGRAREGAWPVGLRGAYPPDLEHLRLYAELAASEAGFERYLERFVLQPAAAEMMDWRPEELLIDVLAGMLDGASATSRSAPPRRSRARRRCSRASARAASSGSRCSAASATTPSPTASRELFDCAAQGRIDAFFLGGGQIDGGANINLVGVGGYPRSKVRWPGSFGSAYLYFLVPRVILFREEHSRRVLVPKVEFVSAPGTSPPNVYRPGGPYALVTGRAVFRFDPARARFLLQSVHPGQTRRRTCSTTRASRSTCRAMSPRRPRPRPRPSP